MAEEMFKVEVRSKAIRLALLEAPRHFEHHLTDAMYHTKRKFFKTWSQKTKVDFTRRRGLLNRFTGFITRKKPKVGKLKLEIWTRSKIAKLHEEGATIKPRGAKFRIPIGPSVSTKRGRTKKAFKKPLDRGDRRFFILPERNIIMRRFRGKKNPRIEPAFALVDSIQIPANLKFFATWRSLRSGFINSRFQLAARRAVKEVNQKNRG